MRLYSEDFAPDCPFHTNHGLPKVKAHIKGNVNKAVCVFSNEFSRTYDIRIYSIVIVNNADN